MTRECASIFSMAMLTGYVREKMRKMEGRCADNVLGNWFGGQAVSLQVNYTHAEQFAAAGYEPFIVDGAEYGEVRQYGNCMFSFSHKIAS